MRDRLIELIQNADIYDSLECKICSEPDDYCKCCYANKFADYLLANGVVVQQKAKWKIKRDCDDFEYIMCSRCKEEFYPSDSCVVDITPNYCPNCGAKMKELGK